MKFFSVYENGKKLLSKTQRKSPKKEVKEALMLTKYVISFKWRVTMSGELMSQDKYGNCDSSNTVTLLLWCKHGNSSIVSIYESCPLKVTIHHYDS